MNNLIRLRDGVAEVCRDDPWQLLRELPDAAAGRCCCLWRPGWSAAARPEPPRLAGAGR